MYIFAYALSFTLKKKEKRLQPFTREKKKERVHVVGVKEKEGVDPH